MAISGIEGDTKDFQIHDLSIQGVPLTLLNPPDTLAYTLFDEDGAVVDSGTIVDFFYVDDDPTDPYWVVTIPLPMNQTYATLRIRVTKNQGVRTFRIPIFVESE